MLGEYMNVMDLGILKWEMNHMKKEEIKDNLKECFRKCTLGREQLKTCVVNAMNAGLTQEEVLTITNKGGTGVREYEASLCAIVAASELLRYEKEHRYTKTTSVSFTDDDKEELTKRLRDCFKKCVIATSQIRKCIGNAMDLGLTHDEVLAITDDIVGRLGKGQISISGIVASTYALSFEESISRSLYIP